jgi:hypothetical protein
MGLAFCRDWLMAPTGRKVGSDMGQDRASNLWQEIQGQLDVVEAWVHELDPRVSDRVVALRREAIAWCALWHRQGSALSESDSAAALEVVQGVQEVVRYLRQILAIEGAALTAPANLGRDSDASGAEVTGREPALVEIEEKLFRVSNRMWEVVRVWSDRP